MSTFTNGSAKYCTSGATATNARDYLIDQHANITSSGWAIASDTGQMDEATVVISGVANTFIGYRVYYLDDSYHATNPIKMRVNYTTGIGGANRVGTTYQFGVQTDGAGTMTGWSSTLPAIALISGTNAYYSSLTGLFLSSFGEGYSAMLLGRGSLGGNNATPVVVVQRSFDQQTGAVVDDGLFYVFTIGYASAAFPSSVGIYGYDRVYNQNSAITASDSYGKTFVPMATTYSSSKIEIYPDFNRVKKAVMSPITASYRATDFSLDNYVTINLLGANHTYRATGVTTPTSAESFYTYSMALIWE